MKDLKIKFLLLQLLLIMTSACVETDEKITRFTDYEHYLRADSLLVQRKHSTEILEFWQKKLNDAPEQSVYLIKIAELFGEQFAEFGDVKYLYAQERNLLAANEAFDGKKASIWRSLAHHYISRHEFKKAKSCLDSAYLLGEGEINTERMLFDVSMELGNYRKAQMYLQRIKSENDFDYLIRLSKFKDHEGDLLSAISLMEKALELAKERKDESLTLWAMSNLADYYGHAGKISESYDLYLSCLRMNPTYKYALQKIAWIAYANDGNTEDSKTILNHLRSVYEDPAYDFLLSSIAKYEGNSEDYNIHSNVFFISLKDSAVQKMYASYAYEIYDFRKNVNMMEKVALKEIKERPTALSYSLLAYTKALRGDQDLAIELVNTRVIGKTEEPKPLFYALKTMKALDVKENNELKSSVLGASFELGPHNIKEIN